MSFYVLQSLPATSTTTVENLPATLNLADNTFANLKPVGTFADDNAEGRASVDFAQTPGRYVMVRWTPASADQSVFAIGEVAAFGSKQAGLMAANGDYAIVRNADEKDAGDSKDMGDAKDVPAEGPATPPSEGPPPSLPQPPPFTFIPQVVPVSR